MHIPVLQIAFSTLISLSQYETGFVMARLRNALDMSPKMSVYTSRYRDTVRVFSGLKHSGGSNEPACQFFYDLAQNRLYIKINTNLFTQQ